MSYQKQLEDSFNDSLDRIKQINKYLKSYNLSESEIKEARRQLKLLMKLNKQFAKELETNLKGH